MAVDPIQSDPLSTSAAQLTPVVPYEKRMDENWEWAMNESSLFFDEKGKVQDTLRRIVLRLEKHGIPYAVAGGMALFYHGHRRYTEDVDLLVTREGLDQIYERLEGSGYIRPYTTSKYLRDTDTGVKIDFLLAGGFPGDGKPKEVAFPDPTTVAEEFKGIKFVNLPTFLNLKLASGMTGKDRDKDLTDVAELVKSRKLSAAFAEQLAPSVRDKFRDLAERVAVGKRFVLLDDALPQGSIDAMLRDGVDREPDGRLVTSNIVLAAKYQMVPDQEI